jgi:hypothetical protein
MLNTLHVEGTEDNGQVSNGQGGGDFKIDNQKVSYSQKDTIKCNKKKFQFFMGRCTKITNNQKCAKGLWLKLRNHKFAVLHRNVQRLNKQWINCPLKH